MILAGDIGGTNTRLAVFSEDGGALRIVAEAKYSSPKYSGLDEIAAHFLQEKGVRVTHAGFGVAGPVRNGRTQAVNLPWVVDSRSLARSLGTSFVALVNDLEAIAHGLATLTPSEYVVLQEGEANATGNRAVIAPGTGLGEAGLCWEDGQHVPFATEGGHSSFAPSDDLEDEMLHYLRRQFHHVSWERVLSGPGLYNIYKFLRDTGRGTEPAWLAEEMKNGDPSARISMAALEGKSDLCVLALDRFVRLLGAEGGNLALKTMARGGVYIGGGIPPKILSKLEEPALLVAFTAKGRMRELLKAMPVRVILNEETALRGAARCALRPGRNEP